MSLAADAVRRPCLPTAVELWGSSAPEGWTRTRLKHLFDSIVAGTWGTDSAADENDIVCVRVADFDRLRHEIRTDNLTTRGVPAADRRSRGLREGDLLIEKSGGGELQPVGFVVLFEHAFPAVCSNFIARLRPSSRHDSRFLNYVFAALYTYRVNGAFIKQTTGIQNLDLGAFFGQSWFVPSREVQTAIVQELEHKLTHLDHLVAMKRRLRALLGERRRAVIDELFWSSEGSVGAVRRLKYCISSIEQGWSPECENRPAADDEWGVLKTGCVNSGALDERENKALPASLGPRTQLEVRSGDILMSRANTRALLGSVAVVDAVRPRLLLSDKLYRLRPNPVIVDPRYLVAGLQSTRARVHLEGEATGASASMQNISQGTVRELRLPVPSLEEQRRLVAKLDERLRRLRVLDERVQRQLTLLDEHRATLIFDAVTGRLGETG
jgi:type I restriction enzyme S subunit